MLSGLGYYMAETIAPASHVCPSRFVEDPQVILARCNWMREEKVGVSPFNMGVVHVLATLISGPCLASASNKSIPGLHASQQQAEECGLWLRSERGIIGTHI